MTAGLRRCRRGRQRAVDGLPLTGPRWADDPDFDPDLHFHHVALPAPHDRRALEDFIGDRIATPFERARPLWEVYLIDDYGPGCALLVRIHHSIADGIALARVMLTLTDGGDPQAPESLTATGALSTCGRSTSPCRAPSPTASSAVGCSSGRPARAASR